MRVCPRRIDARLKSASSARPGTAIAVGQLAKSPKVLTAESTLSSLPSNIAGIREGFVIGVLCLITPTVSVDEAR